jgi:hypothetical protein
MRKPSFYLISKSIQLIGPLSNYPVLWQQCCIQVKIWCFKRMIKLWSCTLAYSYYYWQLTEAPSHQRPTQLCTLRLHPNLIKINRLFRHSRRRPIFRLSLDGWPKRAIFGNMFGNVQRKFPNNFNLPLIVALDKGLEPYFSYSLLFEIRSVSQVPNTIRKQFLWETSIKSSSIFGAPMLHDHI